MRYRNLHSPDLYGSTGVGFGAGPNLLFPRPVRIAVEDHKMAFISAAAIHIAVPLVASIQ
jgi:hypothetical protein